MSAYGKAGYLKESVNYEKQGDLSDLNNAIKKTTTYAYYPSNSISDLDFLLKTTTTTINDKEPTSQEYLYPDNFPNEYSGLISKHIVNIPIETKSYKGNTLLSYKKTHYDNILPSKIQTAKGAGLLEDRLLFHSYDADGNIQEVSQKGGTHSVYIWGYDKTQPIAKIENATYADISSYVTNLQALSDADNDRTFGVLGNEGALRVSLETMRTDLLASLPNAVVTYYTYDPLIGVTSITDPRGQSIYYEYDDFGRLEFVRDHEGNILSENQYNYKN